MMDLALLSKVDRAEIEMLKLPQVSCPVNHYFGPGIYIREVLLAAGILAIGHHQKTEHINVMIKGRVIMVNDDGSTIERVAPLTYVGKPGRKAGYILEDVVWQNIYATNERDIEKLESMFLDKSPAFIDHEAQRKLALHIDSNVDRQDYLGLLKEYGLDAATVTAQSENQSDQMPFPEGIVKVFVADSIIHGKGLFASSYFNAGQVIAPARLGGFRTPAGRFTNHSITPNALMSMSENEDIYLIANKSIKGLNGGESGDEITVDYRQSLATIGVKKCLA